MQTLQQVASARPLVAARPRARPASGRRLRVLAAGLSPEQQAFLDRKAREARSASPAPTRGRSGSARPTSVRPTSRPAPAAAPAPSYSSSSSASSAGGLTPEQQEFLARRAQESRSPPPAAAPTRGRSGSQRPASVRPSSRAPSPVRSAAAAPSSYAAPASSSAASASAGGLTPEQQEFLARRAQESRSPPPAAAPARGRSGSQRPASVRPSSRAPSPVRSAAPSSYTPPPPAQPEPRVGDVEFARAALERTLQTTPAVHPRDQVPAPAQRAAPTGPSTGKWPDAQFFHETAQAFPAKAVCDAEEARALMDLGYHVLDCRSELESGNKGKLRASVMIPCIFQRQQFDQATGQMVIEEHDNPGFMAQVFRKFPKKDAKIIVMCADGREHSIDVLEALDEEGYTNLVGLQGGYNAFTRVFDVKLNPKDRRPIPKRQLKKLI